MGLISDSLTAYLERHAAAVATREPLLIPIPLVETCPHRNWSAIGDGAAKCLDCGAIFETRTS